MHGSNTIYVTNAQTGQISANEVIKVFNRPGVAGPVIQTPPSLVH